MTIFRATNSDYLRHGKTLTWLILLLCTPYLAEAAEMTTSSFVPPLWTVIPFVGILLSIALCPLLMPNIWHHNYGKIGFLWVIVGYLFMFASSGDNFLADYGPRLFLVYEEYIAFIALLGSLFIISGGINISGTIPGVPVVNTAILFIGSILASLIGTTGAAMLLIRPLLRANKGRKRKVHIVLAFIFLVCNIGGALTPIGDPPLFLGFLQGIPFEWTLKLFPMWLFCITFILTGFYFLDRYLIGKVPRGTKIKIKIEGSINIILLLGVVASVIASGVFKFDDYIVVGSLGKLHIEGLLRELTMVVLALMSLVISSAKIRRDNNFNYEPILEVAYLFIAIFTTMAPALMLLNARGSELGIASPMEYFWYTGILSSFLDNAPTYLAFLHTSMGYFGVESAIEMTTAAAREQILLGISAGAVFMGANTYIGNGPNFMVRAIAEHEGVRMPSFFGYAFYAGITLIPLYIVLTQIFF